MSFQRRFKLLSSELKPSHCKDEEVVFKVAFATQGTQLVDQHFGSSRRFVIYEVGSGKTILNEEIVEFVQQDQDGREDKLNEKLQALFDCHAVYCTAVGGSALRRLLSLGITAIKVPTGVLIKDLLSSISQDLRAGRVPWPMVRHREKRDLGRFDEMEREGWFEE